MSKCCCKFLWSLSLCQRENQRLLPCLMHAGLILGFWSRRSLGECRAIQLAIDLLIPYDGLNIFARLSKWDGFYEFVEAVIVSCRAPIRNAVVSRIVGGEGVFLVAAEFVERLAQVA